MEFLAQVSTRYNQILARVLTLILTAYVAKCEVG